MTKKEFIAIAMLVKDESERIEQALTYLISIQNKCRVYVFDDDSTDNTIKKIDNIVGGLNEYRIHLNKFVEGSIVDLSGDDIFKSEIPIYSDSFAEKRNVIHETFKLRSINWVLFIDADEQFDPWFLMNIKEIIDNNPDKIAFKFPRLNLPHGKDSPDYQVRLLNIDEPIFWEREIHEIPFIKRENGESEINLHDYIGTKALDDCPILHDNRNGNKRHWW